MKNFLNGLVGLLLVGVMACTGLGQTFISNEEISLTIQDYLVDRDALESSVNGNWGIALTNDTECINLSILIDQALAGPHFDPNYNGDPDMLADKQAFIDARQALDTQRAVLNVAKTSAKRDFGNWNDKHPAAAIEASRAFWADKNFYAPSNGYSFAQIETGLNQQKSIIISNCNQLTVFLSVAENSAGGFLDLKTQYQTLLDAVEAY